MWFAKYLLLQHLRGPSISPSGPFAIAIVAERPEESTEKPYARRDGWQGRYRFLRHRARPGGEGGFEPGVFRKSLRFKGLWRKTFADKDLGLSCGCAWLRVFSCVCPLGWSHSGHKASARGLFWLVSVAGNCHRRTRPPNGGVVEDHAGSVNGSGFKSRSPRLTPWCLRNTMAREWGRGEYCNLVRPKRRHRIDG